MLDVSFACADWVEKLRRGQTPIPALPLDDVEADAAVDLFNLIRVPDIPGQPRFAEAGGEWVRDMIRAAFGSIDPETGARFVGEIFNLVPKKNSKTTNAAAIGLVALLMNKTPNIDGVIIGPSIEVADKCFAQCTGMIEADPYLSKRFKVVEHKKMIVDLHIDEETGIKMNAKLKVKSFDPKVVTGSIPAFAILDELHVMAESAHANRVIGQIRGGMITNKQSLLIFITTQSEIPPQGVFKDELAYARGVRDGRITNGVRMLPVLYEFPEEIQRSEDRKWMDTKLWPMVLPNLGRSVTIERLVPDWLQAQDKGPVEMARWASQHLNIELGMGLHSNRWVGADYWEANGRADLDFETFLKEVEVAVVGGDVGGADDLFGLSVIGRHKRTRHWLTLSWAWCTEVALKRRPAMAEKLRDLEKTGAVGITQTSADQVSAAADICVRLRDTGLLPAKFGIGLDPHGVAALLDELERRGFDPANDVLGVGQGYKLNGAIKGLERRLQDGNLKHGAQPLMAWCVGNARAEQKGNNIYITKEIATGKIDPLIALFNAAMLMDANPQPATLDLDDFLSNPVVHLG